MIYNYMAGYTLQLTPITAALDNNTTDKTKRKTHLYD